MTKHLFLVSIGPVQEFIASARRSRDLWFGSWLLSELSKTAASTIVKYNHMDRLIFPAPTDKNSLFPGSNFNVANKIVAEIDQEPHDLAKKVKEAMDVRLTEIRNGAFDGIKDRFRSIFGEDRTKCPFNRTSANKQVDDLIEFLWVGVPLSDNQTYIDDEGRNVRKHMEALMAARKNTRNFQIVQWREAVPKSSLDGQRESVIPKKAFDSFSPEQLYTLYKVKENEYLCGIGLLKRLGRAGKREGFPSTSHIAAGPLLHRLKKANDACIRLKEAWDYYFNELPENAQQEDLTFWVDHPVIGKCDGSALYEERLGDTLEGENLRKHQDRLKEFYNKAAQELNVSPGSLRPSPYYALLLADGDNMGKAIDHQDSPDKHRGLSLKLAEFAKSVQKIVEASEGALVYAGGDDVLAFVPLHTVLECANTLATSFYNYMKQYPYEEPQPTKKYNTPTLSVGIAIAHHVTPLSDALELAHRAEKAAKAVKHKNGLAIAVNKRSGSETIVADTREPMYRRLTFFRYLHQNDEIPDGAAYELRDLANRLVVSKQDPNYATLQEAMEKETFRILKRKKAQKGQNSVATTYLEQLEWELIEYMKRLSFFPIRQCADEMIVARLFAEARVLADIQSFEYTPEAKEQTQ